MSTTKLQFKHDFDPDRGHEVELTIRCRLGSAPTLLRQLIEASIEPLAQQYDPHWKPQQNLPVTPPDDDSWLENEPNDFGVGPRG